MTRPALSPVASALGRMPTGLYIVTTVRDGAPIGFLGSFAVQVGFAPPTLCVAVGKDRPHLADLESAGHFALSVIDKPSQALMSAFLRKLTPGTTPFDGLRVATTEAGTPYLLDALAWIGCRYTGRHDSGDHAVVFGEVLDGALLREGEPLVHVRKNGLSY